MERPVKIEYVISLMRRIYPDQCWEIDPGRTVLTQYIARHPHAIEPAFRVGEIVRIDEKVYVIGSTLSGYFGVNKGIFANLSDWEWYVTTVCYFLKPPVFDTASMEASGWYPLPGNIIEPKAVPTMTTGALYNQRVKDPDEIYDLGAEMYEARNRFKLVVAELNKIRKREGLK